MVLFPPLSYVFLLSKVYYLWYWAIHGCVFGGVPKFTRVAWGAFVPVGYTPPSRFSTVGKPRLVVVAVQGAPFRDLSSFSLNLRAYQSFIFVLNNKCTVVNID